MRRHSGGMEAPGPRVRRAIIGALAIGVVAVPMALAGPKGGKPGPPQPPGAVPGGVSVSGLTAGQGSVDIREYIDLATAASGQAHQRITGALLRRVAAEQLGSISLRPLATSTDVNSTEAGQAVVAAANQDKAWEVTSALVRAQGAGGDWINPGVLRKIARRINGLDVARFMRDAGPSAYPQLNIIRQEATAAGVTVTPAYVVQGPGGSRVVTTPGNAQQVIEAIRAVR